MSDVTARLVDDEQRERLVRRFGGKACDWLDGLPALVDEFAAEWKLTIDGPTPHGQTSVVLRCRRVDGTAAMLKISPDPGLAASEARILRLWEDTRRVPAVWESDRRLGGLLLEAIEPGRTVSQIGEVPPMETIAELIQDLHSADIPQRELRELHPLHSRINFVFSLWEHYRSDGPAADVVPASVLHHAHARARALAASEDNVAPLHGDLHPGNVLDGGPDRGLVAVDPRACVGDAAADAVDWPLWKAESVTEIERRAGILAPAIGSSPERLLDWCRACAPMFAIAMANRGETDRPEYAVLTEFAGC
ncbi:streptomycin 6-kinase [Spinactinospora alkalitolerans]|uniref:Streptomycin 6-kinase n=1 Tax=Spinactinospora alkalitolerans TaxID=687207 RepID=A0A852U0B9_9ACTN|nr:aminoglycoside phosphotransferase family protein [Spinactinospora alkalitolerans]NYE49541.1 streptomycin 6-kinase [Spinactinospora alkalitolerans]